MYQPEIILKMKHIKRRLIRKLPNPIRGRIIRSHLPDFRLSLEGILFRPAVTLEDYIMAFRLLHDVYVESGYIEPAPNSLRVVPQHAHPDSRVFLGCRTDSGDRKTPVYTISLFPDSEDGLPMDTAFGAQLDRLRDQGRTLAEVGCLASSPCCRKKDMNIPMLGNRIVHQYAVNYLDVDDLVITVHPKYKWVYEDVLLFENIGNIKKYPYVKYNPAVAMRLDLRSMKNNYHNAYHKFPAKKNLYRFFYEDFCSSIQMYKPENLQAQMLANHLFMHYRTPELFKEY